MNTTTTHAQAPTPWRVSELNNDSTGDPEILDAEGDAIVAVYDTIDRNYARARASLIVRAVNSHESLVAALEETAGFVEWLTEQRVMQFTLKPHQDLMDALGRARSALALAKQEDKPRA